MTMAYSNQYSIKGRDAKVAGVCSTLGAIAGVDPTFIRIGFVAAAIFTSFVWTLVAYAAIGIVLSVQKKKQAQRTDRHASDFDRMAQAASRRPSVHALRTELDPTDRRLMAIDHHIHSQNDELGREIEKLREPQEDK
jgi:phage shock protein PspC (stress-responsive transcriptional regulator)